jgi:mono/diheme cytochrome c family protein
LRLSLIRYGGFFHEPTIAVRRKRIPSYCGKRFAGDVCFWSTLMKKILLAVAATLLALMLGGWLFVVSGLYDVAADRPHTAIVHAVLNTLRSRSIEAHARDIRVPPLKDAERISEGAEHYTAMCTGCHLAPGMPETEIRQGLLPKPPDLARHEVDAAQAFWVIKHGIKATAMPAWGKTHDDEAIWNLVAFIRQLPSMSPEQYRAATATDADERASMPAEDHEHDHSAGHEHEHTSAHHEH